MLTIVVPIGLILFVFVGYPIFMFAGYPAYRKYCAKKNMKKFEKSLVDLQHTVQDALCKCKQSIPPGK